MQRDEQNLPVINPMAATDLQSPAFEPRTGFHIMTKPVGPICNLDCKYCFYLEKENLYPQKRHWEMPEEVLDSYIRQYIQSQNAPVVTFAWQGGEPTLLGVDYFRRVVDLEKKYASGKTIENTLQTNGTLLDDRWCEFLAENRFLVGLSRLAGLRAATGLTGRKNSMIVIE